MPSPRTEVSELSVGFGILSVWPLGLTPGQVIELFESTLATEKYQLFTSEFEGNQGLYQPFTGVLVG
jgi:hypothetical protein